MNLTEALTRWSELEPERCELLTTSGIDGVLVAYGDDDDDDPTFVTDEKWDHPTLEYALREAISARPNFWDWQIRGSKEGVHYAEINFIVPHPRYKNYSASSSSSAAHALLKAYVAYLEGLAT